MTPKHVTRRPLLAGTIATLAIVVTAAWVAYSYRQGDAAASAPATLPQVVVSKPLERGVDSRLGFLGQFSAVEHLELRAQVGGTLTGILFKDGDIVHQGDLLFTIDPRPYEIRLAQANAQLETANARLVLAGRELHRAEVVCTENPIRMIARPNRLNLSGDDRADLLLADTVRFAVQVEEPCVYRKLDSARREAETR